MVKNKQKQTAIIFLIFFIFGLIHGLISVSLNNFVTWLLIGMWLTFTIKLYENNKRHREFNSPHNTAFFVIIPLLIGVFYSIWGSYTGILGENLIPESNFYFSLWSLIFGLPFVIYGSHSIYRCFKKYNVIYFGTKSVKAKVLGYFLAISIIITIISYWIAFYNVSEFYDPPFTPLRFSLDLNLFLLLIITIFNLIIFGFISKRSNIPTRDYIAQRTRRIDSLTTPSTQSYGTRTRSRTIQTPTTTTRTTRTTTTKPRSRTTPTSRSRSTTTKTTKSVQSQGVRSAPRIKDFSKYKPKGSFLSEDDFKCIFCFRLPTLSNDKNRGIVICPNCRYPAHADEFKDWMKTSNLCSRCSAPIPSGFRRNPRIITTKNYITIYTHFLKRK